MFGRRRLFSVYTLVFLSCFVTDVFLLAPPDKNLQSEIQEYLDEEARVAKLLLENYDKRFIPTKPGEPLTVTIDVTIADILKIDDMEIEMFIYIRQRWYDFRLSWNSTLFDELKIRQFFLDKIWLPDVRILNMKDAKRFDGFGEINVHIHPDGKVYFSQTVFVTTSCPMDLHTFPLDRQTCFLNFSTYAYGRSLLNYTTGGMHAIIGRTRLPQFDLVETREIEGESKSPGVTISLTFQRRFGYYLMSIYIPSTSIVVLSWLVFFMEPTNVGDRIALEITLTLTIVFLLDGINKSVIHVSYAKASDVFVIVSFCFILLALLETMFVFRLSIFLEKKQKRRCSCGVSRYKAPPRNEPSREDELEKLQAEPAIKCCCGINWAVWIDKICIIIFLIMFLTFNIIYWKYYTSASKK